MKQFVIDGEAVILGVDGICRVSNGEQYLMATDAALQHPVSRRCYWQRQISR
jgi:hypothetical protein